MDSCGVWESHAEDGYDGPDLKFPHTIAPVKEEARPALGSVASDMLRESKGLLLPLPALPPPGVIYGSSDCELLIQLWPWLILPDYLFRWCPGFSSRLLLRCIPRRWIWWTILWLFAPMNSRVMVGEIPGGLVDRPVTNLATLEPLEHSVLEEDLDSRLLVGCSFWNR